MSDVGQDQTAKPKSGSGVQVQKELSSAGDSSGQPSHSPRTVYLLELIAVRDLATSLRLKPFRIVGDLMEMKLFKSPDDMIDFATASRIARKHGFRVERPPPGMLVL